MEVRAPKKRTDGAALVGYHDAFTLPSLLAWDSMGGADLDIDSWKRVIDLVIDLNLIKA